MLYLLILSALIYCSSSESGNDLREHSGFHCKQRFSMQLDHKIHGQPQTTRPPFELSILDENGNNVKIYKPSHTYKVRLVGYVHFRGILLQPRVCSSSGFLIGSLTSGHFIYDKQWEEYGIGFQNCSSWQNFDSITHTNDDRKFLMEAEWRTNKDDGAVQFLVTIASENNLYWEKWRPRNGFIRPEYMNNIAVEENLFREDIQPIDESLLKSNSSEDMTEDPFNMNSDVFEDETGQLESFDKEKNNNLFIQPSNEDEALGQMAMVHFKKSSNISHRLLPTHRDFIDDDDIDPEEKCLQSNPCENGGKCFVDRGIIKCNCKEGYVGDQCQWSDPCRANFCAHNSTCELAAKGTYSCKCQPNYAGTYCQFHCEENQCSSTGNCILKKNGKVGCECHPGYKGDKCDREIDECLLRKCKNAKCIDMVNDFKCDCYDGWMGKLCDRPCQDVYGSCRIWKREGQCESMRSQTDFFDLNCAASCGKCVFLNESVITDNPLPPLLAPLSWLIGVWSTNAKGFKLKTYEYPIDMETSEYNETIIFSVGKAVMFGPPSINFSSIAISTEDSSNIQIHNGYLTIRQYSADEEPGRKAALMTVDNMGVTLIEEGEVNSIRSQTGMQLDLKPTYIKTQYGAEAKMSEKMSRSFSRRGNRLTQLITKYVKGKPIKFTKVYDRIKEFQY